uniref:DBB domain-containing protein n=1 Tax=Astyanax mexicanus TaxID=7994 RepID=A0A8B9LNS4_ASTMX
MSEVLIVYTSETQDWATYLKLILETSNHFPQDSITLYNVDEERPWQEEDFSIFHSSRCTLLLLSLAFLDLYDEPEVQGIFDTVLQPPWKVVAFMCGVSESDGLKNYFQHWDSWHKLDSEDDPSQYVSTVLEVLADVKSSLANDVSEREDQWRTDYEIPPPKQDNDESTLSKYDQTASQYGFTAPKYDQIASEYDINLPKYDQTASEYDINLPKYDQTASEYDITLPKYDQTASEYGLAAPQFSLPSPDYRVTPSEYEVNVPEFEINAPAYEANASEYDLNASEEPEELDLSQIQPLEKDPDIPEETQTQSASISEESSKEQTCLTVQPHRILCGTQVDVYIIMEKKLDNQASVEVEFYCERSSKRVSGTLVNEYIVRAQSPDMPAGPASLHLYSNESLICSTTVTYYTEMEEISSYLQKVMDPIKLMCQAFNITSNTSEALDDLFTASFKSQMPAGGLRVFGVNQLEQENMLANQRNTELPTLLHFSAKYGLKKLTKELLQCPGALQAYSVANKNGDYPNKLAEKSGFSELRQIMDKYVETVDFPNNKESVANSEETDIYEPMADVSLSKHNPVPKFPIQEDIYEPMMELNPDMQLYEDLSSALNSSHPEEAFRMILQENPRKYLETADEDQVNNGYPVSSRAEETGDEFADIYSEEEDPYKLCCPEEIYDTVDEHEISAVLNRPPAPIPRPQSAVEAEGCKTYISTVFCSKESVYSVGNRTETRSSKGSVWPVSDGNPSSVHDPYAGMKTPGQRQLISLQERVKVGALTMEEAVQEFKAWQIDQDRRTQSVRFQQENIQRLRDSITRRHKEKGGNELEITAPMQRNLLWGSQMNVECSVYEPTPRVVNQPSPAPSRPPQRGTWQTGSASSTSSSSSNRLSTLSTISYSSGADGELEEPQEFLPPPRPPRTPVEAPPTLPPPRVPRRPPDRVPESMLNERYISSPPRILPLTPPQRPIPPPPVPRR